MDNTHIYINAYFLDEYTQCALCADVSMSTVHH